MAATMEPIDEMSAGFAIRFDREAVLRMAAPSCAGLHLRWMRQVRCRR